MTLLWFLYAVAPCFLYSIGHLVDQHIIRNRIPSSPFSYLSLSGVICLPVLLILYPLVSGMEGFSFAQGPWIMMAATLFSACCVPYFYAMENDDAFHCTPVFQTTPVFVMILCWLLLGETLTPLQIAGAFIVILASAGSMIDPHHLIFKRRPFLLILLAAFFYSCFVVALRAVAPETHWLIATFWMCCGWFVLSIAIFAFSGKVRKRVILQIKKTRGNVLTLISIQELADIGANASKVAALGFAAVPAALTEIIEGFHPFVIVLLSFLASRLLPSIYTFDLSRRELVTKLACFVLILFGLWLTTHGTA